MNGFSTCAPILLSTNSRYTKVTSTHATLMAAHPTRVRYCHKISMQARNKVPHHTWLEPMRDISIKCWDLTRGTSENTAVVNIAGFLILPGLISVMRKMKGGQRPVDFLKDTAKKNYPGREIVRKARLVQSELEAEKQRRASREYQAPTLDSLVKQVDKCIDEDRLSAAVGVVSRIHEQMEGVQPQVPLTPDQIREKIASLHPEQDEEDILPEDKSEDPAGIQVDEADVWVWVRKLNVKSGTGISGWTNRLIRAMMTRATGDRGVAQDKLNKARIAFANFINAVLDGSMSEKVAALMALTRTALIPKDGMDGGQNFQMSVESMI